MIKFTKMEGLGNDYVYIDCTKLNEEEVEKIALLSSKISDRHFGVGSDGLVLICRSENQDFKMRMFNPDGSEAEMCGNAIRCVGKFVYDNGLTNKKNIEIETLAGVQKLELHLDKVGKVSGATVNMGKPILNPKEIPVISNEEIVKNLKLKAEDREFIFTCVSMGNPHAITQVDDVDNFDIKKYGKILEIDKHFPKKANIEFIQVIDRNTIKMRVWERGTGETLACGTGASAVCVAATLNNLVNEKEEITIKLLGGDLKIKWDKYVYMTGPATKVFDRNFVEFCRMILIDKIIKLFYNSFRLNPIYKFVIENFLLYYI